MKFYALDRRESRAEFLKYRKCLENPEKRTRLV